jgi:predicted RNA polymerase sigma factor
VEVLCSGRREETHQSAVQGLSAYRSGAESGRAQWKLVESLRSLSFAGEYPVLEARAAVALSRRWGPTRRRLSWCHPVAIDPACHGEQVFVDHMC